MVAGVVQAGSPSRRWPKQGLVSLDDFTSIATSKGHPSRKVDAVRVELNMTIAVQSIHAADVSASCCHVQ